MAGVFEEIGKTEQRQRGSLAISQPRELLVTREIRAAYAPDRRLVEDAVRVHGIPGERPDDVPDRLSHDVVGVCEEEVIWGGFLAFHFGHYLTESAARLWPVLPGAALQGRPVVFTTPRPAPRELEWLRAVDVPVVELPESGAIRFTAMRVPEPAWRLNAWIAPEVRDIHLHIRDGLEVKAQPRRGLTWISRQGLKARRKPFDEALLEWILRDRIHVVRPETMSLADQVGALEASDGVAGVVGSAFHTLLMVRNLPRCLMLCSRRFQSAHRAQDRLLGGGAAFVHGLAVTENGWSRQQRSPGGRRILIPETLRALVATICPNLDDDPLIAAFARPERLWLEGERRSGLEVAIVKMLVDPSSITAREHLQVLLEKEGLDEQAAEQAAAIEDLAGNQK